MASAARAPSPADARVPCPLCGGLVHPIAGKCKHCKGDLAALRSNRPAAAAALPALATAPQTAAAMIRNGHATPHEPVYMQAPAVIHPANAHLAVPIAVSFQDGSQPILPQRPSMTGKMPASPSAASWLSWPVIVIILAVLAIVTAVVLMMWPTGPDKASAGTLPPPPAPERMDTSPQLPTVPGAGGTHGGIDPWSDPNAPRIPPSTPPARTPDIDDPGLDPGSLRDPFASPRGGLGNANRQQAMMMGVMKHACDRMQACGAMDQTSKMLCDSSATLYGNPGPAPTCDAATRCFEQIDVMSCPSGNSDMTTVLIDLLKLRPCMDAMTC